MTARSIKPKAKTRKPATDPARRTMLSRVHIAKKELGLDDETYRDTLERLFGVRSASSLNQKQLVELDAHFQTLGFKVKSKTRGKRRPAANRPVIRKIYAIWGELRREGLVRDARPDGFCARQTKSYAKPDGVTRPEFLTDDEAATVIESLRQMARRQGGDVRRGS